MINPLKQWIPDRGMIRRSILKRLHSSTTDVTSNSSVSEINIPLRKDRDPTAVLRALETTIKRDVTAPHYKYHDDPFLIPLSNSSKRIFALSQESGRKTAMWIRQEHANLFQHRVADPIIESFLPKVVYERKEDVNEDILKRTILSGHLNDSWSIYKLLDGKVTMESKQSLFELVCYYNNTEPLSSELLEENWYKKSEGKVYWKTSPETEELFAILSEDTNTATDAYNTMICATSKYLKVDRAWELFKEAETKNIPLFTVTYNHVISTIPLLKDSRSARVGLLFEMLTKMARSSIKPDIHTFNNALKVVSSIQETQTAQSLCRSLFSEFKHIGITPTLTSYLHALRVFYRHGEGKNALLSEILDEVEGREFVIHSNEDTYFFMTAMDLAANTLQDPVIGDRIHKLLLTGKNYDFLNEGYKESVYYRHLFMLQVKNRSIDEFVKSYYNIMVPHIYIPELSVMDAILDAVSVNDPEVTTPLLPHFWSHIVQFGLLVRKGLVTKALNLMRTQCKPATDSPINQVFGDAAWTVWDHVSNQEMNRSGAVSWNGPILGDIAILLLRADELEKCARIISYFYNEQNSIVEIPLTIQIDELLDAFISRGYSEPAVDLVHYCSDCGIEDVPSMVQKIMKNLPLSEWQQNRLKSLISPDALKISSSKSQ